jgi:hypothetical protein
MEKKFSRSIPRPKLPGKYRRSFNWRLSNEDKAFDQDSAIRSLFNSDHLDILEDYLYISRKRNSNHTAMERVQSHLIGEHLETESRIKELKEQITAASPSETEKDDPDVQSSLNRTIQELRLYANCLRVIGDGIAWRALGFDRTALRALCANRGCQSLMSEGLAHELKEWYWHFQDPEAIAIVNSLTNWLTIGDVTVIKKNDSVEVVEVKSGRTKSSRNVRQRGALRELVSFLNTGSRIEEQKYVQVYDLNIEAEHGFSLLEPLFAQAERSGYAMKEISSFYFVVCEDLRSPGKIPREQIETEREERIKDWVHEGDQTMRQSSLAFLTFSPLIAPFSIFPLPERTCLELAIGMKFYSVTVNLGAVAREFERRGWRAVTLEERAQKQAEQNPEDPISRAEGLLVVQKEGKTTGININEITRMQMELMRPQVHIKALNQLYSACSPGIGREYFEYKLRESHIWR